MGFCASRTAGSPASRTTLLRRSGGSLASGDRSQRLLERPARGHHGCGLVPAVGHAVRAAIVVPAAVLRPVGGLDQLLVGLRVAVAHQVAGALPAEQRVARNAPRGALVVDLALEEVEEER